MSGHSKWNSIKHQKAATDAKKGAVFTRMAKNVTLAAKQGGGDPETNFKLRMAIDQAKTFNVPKDNIERAIKRGIGEAGEDQLQEVLYEGYGPGGVAIIISVVTDNTNRAVSDIRHALTKHNGSLAESGSVVWNFELKGVVRVNSGEIDKDVIELTAIDAGAHDIINEEEMIMITTDPKNLQTLKQAIDKQKATIEFADIEYVPKNTVNIDTPTKKKLNALTNSLEELEDVQDYYTNDAELSI
jgi:YebC/PmpR family DNA-binding regulatory protein